MRPDQIGALHSEAFEDDGVASRVFVGIAGLAVGVVVGFIVALFSGLIPFSC